MNRRAFAALAASGLLIVTTAAASRPDSSRVARQQSAAKVVTVTIVFQCSGTRSVSPWQVRVAQGDEIDWVLDPSSDVTEFEIKKKTEPQSWLFLEERPEKGRKDRAFRGRQMRAAARGTHPYNIEALCPNADGTTRTELIDPDIIVD